MPQEPPCTPADPVQSDWTSPVPQGALELSQSLHLLPPPAHREHSWGLGFTFPAAPLMGMVEFQTTHVQSSVRAHLGSNIFYVELFRSRCSSFSGEWKWSCCSFSATPRLPPPPKPLGSHHLPSSAACSPGPISCTDWIFIISF